MANLNDLKEKALAAMGTIIDKSTELYGVAEEKAKYIAKTTKLKADIAKENSDMKKLYADLGSLYYCMHKDSPEDGLLQICEEIKVIADKIELKQHELESIIAESAAADIDIDIIVEEEPETEKATDAEATTEAEAASEAEPSEESNSEEK